MILCLSPLRIYQFCVAFVGTRIRVTVVLTSYHDRCSPDRRFSPLCPSDCHRAGAQSIVDQNSAEYLDGIEEEWNKKVDREEETLVDGIVTVDLVSLASVRSPFPLCCIDLYL